MSASAYLGPQRQRHGVTKAKAEGVGGVLVGAALVLIARSIFSSRRRVIEERPAGELEAADERK
jgi:hypothetical protein